MKGRAGAGDVMGDSTPGRARRRGWTRPLLGWVFAIPLGLVCGAAAGALDLQSVEVQPVALLVLAFAGVLGFARPRGLWLWVLLVGGGPLVAHLVAPAIGATPPYPVSPNRWAALVALIPAFAGAFGGATLNWAVTRWFRKREAGAPVDDVERFFAAVKTGDVAALRTLLDAKPALLRARNSEGLSPVMCATYHERSDVADELLSRRAELDIFDAAAVGANDRVRELVRQDPGLVHQFSADGFQPLALAASFGRAEALSVLLEAGADPNEPSRNTRQVRPLHSAVAHRRPEAALRSAEVLLSRGAEVNVAQPGGWTPLHQAAASGHAELVKLLLRAGADVQATSDDGRTAAQLARDYGCTEVSDLLSRHSRGE